MPMLGGVFYRHPGSPSFYTLMVLISDSYYLSCNTRPLLPTFQDISERLLCGSSSLAAWCTKGPMNHRSTEWLRLAVSSPKTSSTWLAHPVCWVFFYAGRCQLVTLTQVFWFWVDRMFSFLDNDHRVIIIDALVNDPLPCWLVWDTWPWSHHHLISLLMCILVLVNLWMSAAADVTGHEGVVSYSSVGVRHRFADLHDIKGNFVLNPLFTVLFLTKILEHLHRISRTLILLFHCTHFHIATSTLGSC